MHPDPGGNDPAAEVVVPRRPGPLHSLPSARPRAHDEVDQALDEVFGTDSGPAGATDLALILGGVTLLMVGVVADRSTLTWVGAAVLALGLILPARDLVRSARSRRAAVLDAGARQNGYPLRVRSTAVADLVDQYSGLLGEVDAARDGLGPDALEAAHLALVEVAALLDERDPVGTEIVYVQTRAAAVADLRAAVADAREAARAAEAQVETAARDAGVSAMLAHDETAGDSLSRMRALREALDERG